MKTRLAIRLVERAGARLVRQKGSHEVYRLTAGHCLVVPFSGSHLEVSPRLAQELRRYGIVVEKEML